ncbi:hypothetical protein EDB19DRAFT_2001708 [Suillus lakei]|nr:hypothetical protein EDB19DRAFT_2001708 [Suillus lakei]
MSTRCPACFRDNFTVTGLSQHLAKSRNPHCRALYHQSHSQLHTSERQNEPDESTAPDPGGYGEGEPDESTAPEDEFPQWGQEQYDSSDGDGDEDDEPPVEEWEPPIEEQVEDVGMDTIEDLADEDEHRTHQDIQACVQGQCGCVVVPYLDPRAGQQITRCRAANAEYEAHLANEEENLYHPFASKMEWEVARWAKLRGLSSTALSDLLAIEGVSERLSLSFKNANELNAIVDHGLPTGRPKFKREQIVVAGEAFKFGECPKCDVDVDETGSNTAPFHLRNLTKVLDALAALDEGNLSFVCACLAAGIKPIVHPFWEDLPFTNIFHVITPDVLHQLYQGLIKHLLGWLSAACGAAEIDAQCRCLPPNHHIHLFSKGITCLSRISGTEHAQICCFLLGIVIGIRLPNNLNVGRLLRAVQGLLDFLYLAQYPCHSSKTLQLLDDALNLFHENKDIFVDLGIRSNFNLPKLHAARHYPAMIMMFGTMDNYNTEYTERLHIDFVKDAYRATNHKDEFVQMTRWLERKEKILRHDKYVNWRCAGVEETIPYHSCPPDMTFRRLQSVAKHPSAKAISIDKLVEDYGATYFREALARYITQLNHASNPIPLRSQTLDVLAQDVHFPFRTLPVFHKVKWLSVDARGHGDATATLDSVHARPQRSSGSGLRPRRSDTALVSIGGNPDVVSGGIEGVRVGQVRVIFSLPSKSVPLLFPPTVKVPTHFAYIEWFEPFASAPDRHHGLYKLLR